MMIPMMMMTKKMNDDDDMMMPWWLWSASSTSCHLAVNIVIISSFDNDMVMMVKMKMMLTMMMTWWWWWHGDDAVVVTWWHDDMMTWCHDHAVPLIQTSTAIESYKGQNICVYCNFTLHHCKFTVLPDPLIVNLQCAEPPHCKFTVGTSCEIDAKEMAFTMGLQWFYSDHTVNLQCEHCKIIKCRDLIIPLPL